MKTVPDSWPNFLNDVFTSLNPEQPSNLTALLEFLKILPEEVLHAEIGTSQKSKVNAELCGNVDRILAFLDQCLNHQEIKIRQQSLVCLQSWIHFDVPVLSFAPIINRIFSMMAEESMFETVVDVLTELIQCPQSANFESSICSAFIQQISSGWFRTKFEASFQDEDFVKSACRLLVTIGETYTSYLIEHLGTPEVVYMLQMILRCTDYPGYFVFDEEFSDSTLNFWFVLHDDLLDELHLPSADHQFDLEIASSMESLQNVEDVSEAMQTAVQNPDILPAPKDNSAIRNAADELFSALIHMLRRKSMFPDDAQWKSASIDEQKRFLNYRRELADTMVYGYYIVRQKTLSILGEKLAEHLRSSTIKWQEIEATLFCIKAVAEVVENNEQLYMPNIIEMTLSSVPQSRSPRLCQTAVNLIGNPPFSFILFNAGM